MSQLGESLAEILLRASTIAQDRRKTRYPRLRKAVEAGLEPASVLSAKQPKGKRRNLNNVGGDPQLPDDVAARLINLQKRDGESKNNQTYLPGSQPSAAKPPTYKNAERKRSPMTATCFATGTKACRLNLLRIDQCFKSLL